MNLEGCLFLLTFKCVATCTHCVYRASPDRRGVMTVKDFKYYMTVLSKEQSLDWVTLGGGEPFLFYETLKRCIDIAHRLGQKKIGVVTSGYWGGNPTNAQKKLAELKEAGLSSIQFCVDAFHQEFVPLRSVRIAINAARIVGFDRVVVEGRFLGSVDSRNAFNSRTEECIERLGTPEGFSIMRKPLDMGGRACDQLAGYLRYKARFPKGGCMLLLRTGGILKDPKTIEIDFMGNVTICPGLCIGNAKTTPLSRIIKEYCYSRHPIIGILADHGPCGLLELPAFVGTNHSKKYVNECHLCYELRKQLKSSYPEFLASENCYVEE